MAADDRLAATRGLAGFIGPERRRLFDDASPERREQLRAAERRGKVFAAWNAVCSGTREGSHVTGLHYVPESNELVVYLDGPSWTQEMTMLREIIRARMAAHGADVDRLVFKTSRTPAPDAARKGISRDRGPRTPSSHPPAPRAPLTPTEDATLAREVAPIADARLRESLHAAMKASLEWQKGEKSRGGDKRP